MKYLDSYKLFESNDFKFFKGTYGINCEFKCDLGKGRALLIDNKSTINIPFKMNDDELLLFGIDTTPSNSGVGKLFLNKIFDEFKLSKIYLPSSEDHPVWNKIATKTDITIEMGSKESRIYTLTKEQLK
jgi:hypothetical protein